MFTKERVADREDASAHVAEPAGRSRSGELSRTVSRLVAWDGMGALAATIGLVLVTGVLRPDFLSAAQLIDVAQSAVYVGLLAAGMAFLLAMRELDLSVGSTFALTLTGSALLMQHGVNPWLAAAAGVLGGAPFGSGPARESCGSTPTGRSKTATRCGTTSSWCAIGATRSPTRSCGPVGSRWRRPC